MKWMLFVAGAVVFWGMYGPALHQGQVLLGNPWRALLCVGVAYFLIGILVPVVALSYEGGLGVGFVFQDHLLLPQCTVLENVLIPTLVGDIDREAPARARALLERVGLADRLDHRPAELSGGERQRVSLARALIRQPPLLLCDEPTGNLDHAAGDVVTTMLFDLHRQRETVLVIVTHNTRLAAQCPIRFELVGLRLERLDGSAESRS